MTTKNVKLDQDKFWRDGFVVLRGLFSRSEFRTLRERVMESLHARERDGTPVVDCLAETVLAPYVYDERLLTVARRLLGSSDIAYFGDSNYAVVGHNYEPGRDVGGWHRDNTDRSDTTLPDWDGRYSLIRFGLYLQDHGGTSGGLIVRRTSHDRILRGWRAHLADRYLNTREGDVGVWSMRIQHAGLGRCLRGMPWFPLGPHWQKTLPEALQAPFGAEERAGFWVSYGLNDHHLQRHCDYLVRRTERLEMWRDAYYSAETRAACVRAGLTIIDMPARIRAMLEAGETVGDQRRHYQLAV